MRYKIVVCSGKWDTRAVCFVGVLDGNRQEMLGGNNFHPASSRYSMHWKHNPIHYLLTTGTHSSLRARGYVGCWVEFYPASLSEEVKSGGHWASRILRAAVGLHPANERRRCFVTTSPIGWAASLESTPILFSFGHMHEEMFCSWLTEHNLFHISLYAYSQCLPLR